MSPNQTQRPQYFENQYLGAADLTAAVEYARLQQARHALGAHTWGIAQGLQLVEKDSSSGGGQIDLFIQPGFAWDGFGRPVVVLAPYKLSTEKFKSLAYDAAIDNGNPQGRPVEVWLRYAETATRAPAHDFENCGASGNFSRVDELFQVEVGARTDIKDRRDPLSVAGRTLDARSVLQSFDTNAPLLYDESVAYQTYPDPEERARWLIPLGVVRWLPENGGQPGKFVERNGEDLKKSRSQRRYAGVVGESVAAADGVIRLRDRAKDYSAHQSDDLVWVEGDLRVEGDARLFGGALELLDQAGRDNGAPLSVRRLESNDKGGRSLQAQIGAAQAGANRFEVGPVVGNAFQPRLTVLDNGNVGFGTTDPNRRLTLQGTGGTYLNVKDGTGADTREVLLGADGNGGIVSTMTNHDLQLRAGANSTKMIVRADGNVRIGTNDPSAARLVIDGITGATSWKNGLALVGDSPSGIGLSIQNKQGHSFALFASGSGNLLGANGFGIWDETANAYRLGIDGSGNVGIGTHDPADTLDVQGSLRILTGTNPVRFTSVWSAFPDNVTNHAEICNDTTFHKTLMIVGNRSAGQGRKVSIWDYLQVNGTLQTDLLLLGWKWRLSGVGDGHGNDEWLRLFNTANDGYFGGFAAGKLWSSTGTLSGSDIRLKEEVATLDGTAAAGLLALRGVRFKWRDAAAPGGSASLGLIAQEVEEVFPELVETGPGGMKGINYSGLLAPLVEAFKHHQREIDALREELLELKRRRRGPRAEAR